MSRWKDFSRLKINPLDDMGEPQLASKNGEDDARDEKVNAHEKPKSAAQAETPRTRQSNVPERLVSDKEHPTVLFGFLKLADRKTMGIRPPGHEERRWIEAAVRRMFRALSPLALETVAKAFREWKLPPETIIVKQGSSIDSGPGLCILFEGVVDALYWQKGGSENEKVCTYDRPGQCFCELELFYDTPKAPGSRRKTHWATLATRSAVTLWAVERKTLRGNVPGAKSQSCSQALPAQLM